MTDKDYLQVKIPTELVEEIDRIVGKGDFRGYKTRSEFIKDAIRDQLRHYEKILIQRGEHPR